MDYTSTRSFTMTLAHRAVEDVRRGGLRQLRNYVDMCAVLAKKPAHREFFAQAQRELRHADNHYYNLVHTLLDTVEEDRVCTVGVNFGFSSLVYGASRLKQQAEQDGKPFSWLNLGRCGDIALEQAVPRAAQGGSYTWVLDATTTDPAVAAPLARANPQSAFGLLVEPAALTPEVVEALAPCMNLVVMPILPTPELTPEFCRAARLLRSHKMLYLATVLLDEQTAPAALDADFLESMAQESVFCLLARRAPLAPATEQALRSGVVASRQETGSPVILLDWDGDIAYLNKTLSPLACVGTAALGGVAFPLGSCL